MPIIDAASYARQYVNADRAGLDQNFQTQKSLAENKIRALKNLDAKVSAFDTILDKLGKNNSLSTTKATMSTEGIVSATSSEGATPANYTIEVSQLAKTDSFAMSFSDEKWLAPNSGHLTIDLGSEPSMNLDLSTLSSTATLAELRDAINDAADNPGVQASIVRTGSDVKLVLNSERTGAANSISMSLSAGSGAQYSELSTAISGKTQLTTAQDAKFTFNGIAIISDSNKVDNVVNKFSLTLEKTNVGSPLTVTVARDDKSIVANMQSLVDAYNSLNEEIKLASRNSADRSPALSGDSTVRNLSGQLRSIFSTLPAGTYLTDLGLSFDKKGTLSLDNDKLAKGLDSNPKLLDNSLLGTTGIVNRLTEKLEPYSETKGIFDKKLESLNSVVTRVNDAKEQHDIRMENSYQRYLLQFTQLNQLTTQMERTSSLFSTK